MVEIHGDETRKLYTGKFNRRCWMLDPLESASWAGPTVGQHQLYIPAYFKTYEGLIFVGEHTSYTHAWIVSALDSGIRGAVQLLLGKPPIFSSDIEEPAYAICWCSQPCYYGTIE